MCYPHHFDAFLGEIGKVRHCRKIYDHIHYRFEFDVLSYPHLWIFLLLLLGPGVYAI